jgi:arylformamidase
MIDERIDLLYNNRAAVPDFPQYVERWKADSEAARASLRAQLDVPYGESEAEAVDLFFAEGGSRWLIFYHGGYWRSFDKRDFSFIAPPLVRAGWSVAVVNYALCPAVTMEAQAEQCRRAAAWLIREQQPTKLIVSGHSAGGHLTALIWAADWARYGIDPRVFSGGIALSGLYDLDPLRFTRMNADLRLDADTARALSPIHMTPTVSAPLVAAVGADETSEFLRQSSEFAAHPAWSAVTGSALALSGRHHFNILDDLMQIDSPVWSRFG